MNKNIALVLLISFFSQINIHSQHITILIEEEEKLPEEFVFYTYDQAFFDFKIPIYSIKDDSSNDINLNLKETTSLFLDYGPYQTYFFAEPGKSYEILLPKLNHLSDEWKMNPYFKRPQFHLQVMEKENPSKKSKLNEDIRKFNSNYDPFIEMQLKRYYSVRLAMHKLDSFSQVHFSTEISLGNDYYQDYILYKKAILEFTTKSHDLDKLIEEYFIDKKINFSNPAYRELFNLVFQSYFFHLSNNENFRDVFYNLSTNNYNFLKEYLFEDKLLEEKSIFLNILLHEIYKAYYSINYNKTHLLKILDSIKDDSPDSIIYATCNKLRNSFTSLELTYPVPDFKIQNIVDDSINLEDFKGKYIYLGFCNLKSMSCLQEIEYLKYLHALHSDKIKILTFIIGEEKSDIKEFMEENSILWEIIPINPTHKIMKDYKVKAFPVFYFIDKDGTLLRNPARNPSENFELYLFEFLRSKREF